MHVITTMVDSVDIDSERVLETRSADALKSLNILDILARRTTRKASTPATSRITT
jgi:hypothetical protein